MRGTRRGPTDAFIPPQQRRLTPELTRSSTNMPSSRQARTHSQASLRGPPACTGLRSRPAVVHQRVLSPYLPRAQEGDKRGPCAAGHHLGIAGVADRKADPRPGRCLDPMHCRRSSNTEVDPPRLAARPGRGIHITRIPDPSSNACGAVHVAAPVLLPGKQLEGARSATVRLRRADRGSAGAGQSLSPDRCLLVLGMVEGASRSAATAISGVQQ
jgi:hypothetical protein